MPPIIPGEIMYHSNKNLKLRQSLVNMAISVEPYKRKEPKKIGRKITWTDQQVLEIRALHKFGKMLPANIAERYNTTPGAINSLLAYVTRVMLEPTPEHLPTLIR